jgi:FMN phosphatase YigB (HAD superfamily)
MLITERVISEEKLQVRASDIPSILEEYGEGIKLLSLDCFDTLLWRKTATPKDVFYVMQQGELCQSLGVTAYQRIKAAARAYRMKFITHGHREITLNDIYAGFFSLTPDQRQQLIEEECATEKACCYAFPPFVDLIRRVHAKGLKVVICSDIYLTENQLKALLEHCLPKDVMQAIHRIYCSSEFGLSKSDGLFDHVLQSSEFTPSQILHIGDNQQADFHAPRNKGIKALHFLQVEPSLHHLLRMQQNCASLSFLANPTIGHTREPRYSPFKGVFACTNLSAKQTESLIGYMTFGPLLYTFARFVCEQIDSMQRSGQRPKVFFLLRDAHLLSQACEAYAGKPLGKRVHIRKFGTVAASFRTREDVDHYLATLTPQYYNCWVICAQLLLPQELTLLLIRQTEASPHPEKTFNELLHHESVLQLIFKQSSAYRERLKRYIQKEMALEKDDTVVLVDIGYMGVTQDFLTRALQDELNVKIVGRYFIATHEAIRPDCQALITSTACDHGLFEQSCTYKEGCVLDYDEEGNPVFDQLRLSDDQYAKVKAIQDECLRFIHDTKQFFSTAHLDLSFPVLQRDAITTLRRHVYFPSEQEIHYYQGFQHDKDMGPDLTKTMYRLEDGLSALRQGKPALELHPYEARSANLGMALSALVQRSFDLDITDEDMSLRYEKIKMILMKGQRTSENIIKAMPTYDGYFSFYAPAIDNAHLGIVFGESYSWVQIERISLINNPAEEKDLSKRLVLNQMTLKQGQLFECLSPVSLLMIAPIQGESKTQFYQVVFRPVERR